jgi:hypothetical protein
MSDGGQGAKFANALAMLLAGVVQNAKSKREAEAQPVSVDPDLESAVYLARLSIAVESATLVKQSGGSAGAYLREMIRCNLDPTPPPNELVSEILARLKEP